MFAKAASLVRCLAAFLVCSISFSGWAETDEERTVRLRSERILAKPKTFEETKALVEQGDAGTPSSLDPVNVPEYIYELPLFAGNDFLIHHHN